MSDEKPYGDTGQRHAQWQDIGRPLMPAQMTGELYEQLYRHQIWFPHRSAMQQVQKALGLMPCPACEQVLESPSGIRVRRLCVTKEPHPLGNKGEVLNATCHGCGWQEFWPIALGKAAIAPSAEAVIRGRIDALTQIQIMKRDQEIERDAIKALADKIFGKKP